MTTYFPNEPRIRKGARPNRRKLTPSNREFIRGLLRKMHGDKCHWCGGLMSDAVNPNNHEFMTIEHLVRLADGGSNCLENLRLAHRKCNNSRHSEPRKTPRRQPSELDLLIFRLRTRRNEIRQKMSKVDPDPKVTIEEYARICQEIRQAEKQKQNLS